MSNTTWVSADIVWVEIDPAGIEWFAAARLPSQPNSEHTATLTRALKRTRARQTAAAWER